MVTIDLFLDRHRRDRERSIQLSSIGIARQSPKSGDFGSLSSYFFLVERFGTLGTLDRTFQHLSLLNEKAGAQFLHGLLHTLQRQLSKRKAHDLLLLLALCSLPADPLLSRWPAAATFFFFILSRRGTAARKDFY